MASRDESTLTIPPEIPLSAIYSGYITKDKEGNINTDEVNVTIDKAGINELVTKLNAAADGTQVKLLVQPNTGGKSRKSRGGKSRKTRGGKMRKTKKHKK